MSVQYTIQLLPRLCRLTSSCTRADDASPLSLLRCLRYSSTYTYTSLNFVQDQDIYLHHLGDDADVKYDPITEEVVLQALDIIIDPASSPLMIMCNLGRHRTGTVVGIFRKLQRWNLASILEEYRR